MNCQRCGTKTRVVEVLDYPDRVERRRRCQNKECDYRSVTIEVHHRDSTYFGRIPKTARITREEALEVRAMLAEGKLSQRQIGEKVGLSQQQVSKIARGLSWGYVKEPKS